VRQVREVVAGSQADDQEPAPQVLSRSPACSADLAMLTEAGEHLVDAREHRMVVVRHTGLLAPSRTDGPSLLCHALSTKPGITL
jgi:hypothetical protein